MSEERKKKKSWIEWDHNDWIKDCKKQKQELISEFVNDIIKLSPTHLREKWEQIKKLEVKGTEPREDGFEFISGDNMRDYWKVRGYDLVKREDLQFLFDWTVNDMDDLLYVYNQSAEETKKYFENKKRIKEEYDV